MGRSQHKGSPMTRRIADLGWKCANCAFFRPPPDNSEAERGQCVIDPPRLYMREGKLVAAWPIIASTSGCGQHATVEELDAPKPDDTA